jgi:EAL domain-containing protein (putative c-di-GMP-specific phosphodiesterase class I)
MDLQQHASMGIVLWDATRVDSAELIQNANEALRESKGLNRGSYTLFADRMHERAVGRFTLVQELRKALLSGEVSMNYQPIVDLTSTRVVGFEALMRWRHPQRGFIPPDIFIPLAETSDLIIELGAFALHEAANAARSWDRDDTQEKSPYVTVNLSAHQFRHRDLLTTIEGVLLSSGLSPNRLILEITEGVALQDVAETLEVMRRLRLIGVSIALDDFGTGFSSLSYLTRLQPRIIKIDKSFVNPSQDNPQSATLLEAIISLGMKLDMTMLAEGIETSEQLDELRHLSCNLGQGYLFSPAVPVGETPAMARMSFA